MTSGPATNRPAAVGQSPATSNQERIVVPQRVAAFDRNRPLPPLPTSPASSLPISYDIPTLRRRPAPESVDPTLARHNRSASNPFPSLFNGKKPERHLQNRSEQDENGPSGRVTGKRAHAPASRNGQPPRGVNPPRKSSQAATGCCMTCASTVRWPEELKVFRCPTCLTVNDLEPSDGQTHGNMSPQSQPAVSMAMTRKLIDQCLNAYFRGLLVTEMERTYPAEPGQARQTVPTESSSISNGLRTSYDTAVTNRPDDGNRVQKGGQQSSLQGSSSSDPFEQGINYTSEQQKTSKAGSVPMPQQEPAAQDSEAPMVFRPLERYISDCHVGCTTLNTSFFPIKPASEEKKRSPMQRQPSKHLIQSASTPQLQTDDLLSELDAKTLLLGDVAENGAWWTGKAGRQDGVFDRPRERSPERWRGIVTLRSPRINWVELAEWYELIIHAGDDWQPRWNSIWLESHERERKIWKLVPLQQIQCVVADSQLHLQRALLKSTENLLKRPRRPLSSPEDCRFLLMLLANPLLRNDKPVWTVLNASNLGTNDVHHQLPPGPRNGTSSPAKRPLLQSRRTGPLGQHSGILKRISGLLSNLSNDIHQFLVSWISRFADNHFERLLDMISSFLTYRLSRQQDRTVKQAVHPTEGLVPSISDSGMRHASQLHAALDFQQSNSSKKNDGRPKLGIYSKDWQVRAAARVMAILFQANNGHAARKRDISISHEQRLQSAGLNAKYQAHTHGQIVPINNFYNSLLDHADLIGDFEAWEATKTKFTFCQYPFILSIWAKIHILEHDARRQMEVKAREAFFDSILSNKAVSRFLVLKVRRDCLVDDSLRGVSEVVGAGGSDIKKSLRIDFVGEEGVDAGGLRKEWFLLLVREIFDPQHGLFVYDEDSQYCYFNPFCFESSEQFFLVGVLLGLAIHNSTILDIAFPPFVFKKMMAAAPAAGDKLTSTPRITHNFTLEDLAEYRPVLAKGLRHLLEFEGDVQETFCRDFVVEMDKYGGIVEVPLCVNGHHKPVTNANRREFVDLLVRYLLDTAVVRQFEPFKRGFFSVCGGNALSLFRPEEIELLVCGSDEPLDVNSLRAVATYDNWPKEAGPPEQHPQVLWFWDTFERADPVAQRKLLGFITGSDRLPAMGATNLVIRLQLIRDQEAENGGFEIDRFPIARTCFNTLGLHRYQKQATLETKLWMAVRESEGFGLK